MGAGISSIIKVVTNRRMAAVTLLGFSAGIPLALTSSTLQLWLARDHVDLTTIGIFSLVGLPYTLKFVWAPLMDRFVPPFLGRRRGWMIVTQLGLLGAIGAMGFLHPGRQPWLTAALAVLVAFFSASQDVAVDAYTVEVLAPEERGLGASGYMIGYRIAMLASGGGSMVLADHVPWGTVYLIMAATMVLGLLTTTLVAPELPGAEPLPQSWSAPAPAPTAAPRSLLEVVIESFREFFKRTGAVEVLTFIVIYRLGANLAIALNSKFLADLQFTNTEIGVVLKGFGTAATIVGTLIGGALMVRLGTRRALLTFGVLQGGASVAYLILAKLGHNYPAMVASVLLEYGLSGPALAAFQAFMMSLCDRRYTATQFALVTSFMAQSRYVTSAPSGFLAQHLGWSGYFSFCLLMAIPGLFMIISRYGRWAFPVAQAELAEVAD